MLFAGMKEVEEEQLSLEDEIKAALQRDPWSTDKRQHDARPTLHASLEVGEGQGRCTREVEVIWWPTYSKVAIMDS